MDVCCECCVLSGRGLCDELITRPEESYWLWCVVLCDLETWGPWPSKKKLKGPEVDTNRLTLRGVHVSYELVKNGRVVSSYEYEWRRLEVSCIGKYGWVASTDLLECNGRHCAEVGEVVPVTKHQVMKAYGGVAVKSTPYLIPTVDGNEWSASGHNQFKDAWKNTDWIGRNGGPESTSGLF
jgi:hypothetical protein